MRTFDFSPLYRSTVGFDRLFDLLNQSARGESPPNWPLYNIERTGEDDYRITMALAGFSPDEVELVQKENTLFIAGHKPGEQEQSAEVLHVESTRSFRQSFDLAEHVKVVGAKFENGVLSIELKREVPEALKPRRIEITGGSGQTNVTTLDQSKVA